MSKKTALIVFTAVLGIVLIWTGSSAYSGDDAQTTTAAVRLRAGKPVNISRTGATSMDPEIVAGNGGKAHVIWVEYKAPKELWYNTNETGNWTSNTRLDPPYSLGTGEGGRPNFVMDKSGRLHFIYQGRVPSGNYEAIYGSGKSRSWAPNENASLTDKGMEGGGSNYPTVGVAPDLTRYAVWMDDWNYADRWELFMRFKGPEASTWSSLQILPTYSSCYEPELSIDGQGTAHLIYTRRAFGSAVVWYTSNRTPQNLSTWTTPIAISGGTQIDFPEPTLTSDSFGNCYVVWPGYASGQKEIFVRRKMNGSWLAVENVSATSANSDWPDIAVEASTGVLGVVWQERVNNVWQVYFKAMQKGIWASPVNVSESSAHAEDPTIAFDETGQVHIAYTLQGDIWYSGAESGGPMVLPPVNLAVDSEAASAPRKKNNTLTWEANPENRGVTVTNYRIYRKDKGAPDGDYAVLGTVGGTVFSYRDPDLPANKQFTYNMTAIADGMESMGSEAVTDEIVLPPIYPPTSFGVASEVGGGPRKKDNALTWAQNPQNKEAEVAKYKIYRKKAEATDDEYGLVGSVGPDTFGYRDRDLVNDQKYTYTMTTLSTNGNESDPTPAVTDKVVWPPIYPPANVAVASELGGGPYRKDNTLTWARNPDNKPGEVVKYKILRKELEDKPPAFEVIASVGPDILGYKDRNLVNDQRFTYAVAALSYFGNESERSGTVTDRAVYAPTYPPLSVALLTRLDDGQTAKINVVTWQDNPQNGELPLKSIRVYRKAEGAKDFILYATVPAAAHRFEDKALGTAKKYFYMLATLPAWEIESAPSAPVFEEWVFPPISLNLQTQVNDGLFFEEKVNTIKWKKNPLNDPRTVRKYALWRKEVGQDDAAFKVLAAEIDPTAFEYVDRNLKLDAKYVYALTTTDTVGNESRKSRGLSEN
jgi:hypothetical protein